MAGNSELERLRAEIRKRHAAASRKVARIENQGIRLSGSIYDVRRDIGRIKSYNKAQLNKYLYELMGFTSRSTQFVAGSGGAPITRQAWNKYKNVEKRVNDIGRAHDASVADVYIPFSGMSVRERNAMLHDLERFDRDTPKPYGQVNRIPHRVANAKALEKLTRQMEQKLNKDRTIGRSVRQTKRNFAKILDRMGAGDLVKDLKSLSDKQADILFNYTPMANLVANPYSLFKEYEAAGKQTHQKATINDVQEDAGELIRWAKTLPKK